MTSAIVLNAKLSKLSSTIAKQMGMMAVMMAVTFIIVTVETGHMESGAKVAAIAGPIKAIAAGAYHKLVG